jgi:sirohydrochlorin ferrochelatase
LAESDNAIPKLDDMIQAVGIHEASTHWYNKLAEESGGTTRQRFVTLVATDLERKLYNDDALSYPGANGFSLEIAEIEAHPNLRDFLNECVDYGALVDAPHTTKETNRRPRRKWYLNPVLSPYFRLPHVRTKEPAYLSVKDVLAWLDASQSGVSRVAPQPHNVGREKQSSLFQEENS